MNFILLLIVIAVVLLQILWSGARSQSIIEKWARDNGFELLNVQRDFGLSAFGLRRSRGQIVYRVLVRDRSGLTRSGSVLCGSYWGGLASDQTTVNWD